VVAAADVVAVNVRVTVCAVPGLNATEEPGEKLQLTPAGKFEQARFTVPLNPATLSPPAPFEVKTTLVDWEAPGSTDIAGLSRSRLKLPFTLGSIGQIAATAALSTEPKPVA